MSNITYPGYAENCRRRGVLNIRQIRQLRCGQQVLAKRVNGGGWEPATVVRVNQNGTVRVRYSDGVQETKGVVKLVEKR